MSKACREKWAVHIRHRKSAGEKPAMWRNGTDELRVAEYRQEKFIRNMIKSMLQQQKEYIQAHY